MKRVIDHPDDMSLCVLEADGTCICGAQGVRCANESCSCCTDDHSPADNCQNHATHTVIGFGVQHNGGDAGEGIYCGKCADALETAGWGFRYAEKPERQDTVRYIARAFAESLRADLSTETMREIIRRNDVEPNEIVCATGDFCDSNMNMAEAFQAVMGREIDIQSDQHLQIWADAWALAKTVKFFEAHQ